MDTKLEPVAETGLQFFGKITASISHEIKNILAIVNENAGLLEDLALMGDQGAAVDPQRLKKISLIVARQVGRTDAICKNMNRLAHSVDDQVNTIDVGDLMELLVALAGRFASLRGVALQLADGQDSVKVRTAPFLFMNLLWLCLDFAMDAAGKQKIIKLALKKTQTGAQILFEGLGDPAAAPLKPFPAEPEKGLCDWLGAKLEVRSDNREIVVSVAEDIDGDE